MDSKAQEKLFDLLDALGAETVLEIKRILESSNKVASGMLLKSIDYAISKDKEGSFGIRLLAEDYWIYVNDGRRPGAKRPPYGQWAIDKYGKDPIGEWIRTRGIQFTTKSGRPMSLEQMGFLISRKIGRDGIKAVNFVERAIEKIKVMFADDLKNQWGEEYSKELENLFKRNFKSFKGIK